MIYFPCDSPNEHVLQVVEAWIDLWAASGTKAAFTAIALDGYEVWTPERLDLALASYRPLELYPGTRSFKVTSPDAAITLGHVPTREVKWYNPEKTGLAGDVSFDLPLNGQWSDLLVEFNIWVNGEGSEDCVLALDEVRCWDQYWSEEEKKREREEARP